MALIKCDECGRDVSDKASSCPNCGNPIFAREVNEGRSEDAPWMGDPDVGKKSQIKSSYIKQGLKRLSIFASIIWMGCWYYNKEVSHSKWFGISYYSDEYAYLGLFGLFCIWISQFLFYWVVSGFIKDKKELALENENFKNIVREKSTNVRKIAKFFFFWFPMAVVLLSFIVVLLRDL